MKKLGLLLLFLSAIFIYGKGIEYDLYDLKDIKSISEERRNLINELSGIEDDFNYFKHFYFTSDNVQSLRYIKAEKDFLEFMDDLDAEIKEIRKPSNAKTMQLIYQKVNEKYLHTLDIYSTFSDIFENGKYSFYSSSALYIAVLDKLKIPIKVKENFSHVDVIAYPESDEIRIIAPGAEKELRYIEIFAEFKGRYVASLKENNLIKEDEVGNKTNTEIFNEEYYAGEIKNLKYFVGILYFQECLNLTTEVKSDDNIYTAIMGNMYYPSFRGNMLVSSLALELLAKRKYESIENIKWLELMSRAYFTCDENTLFNYYNDFTDKTLFEKSNLELFDTCSRYLLGKTTHPGFKKHVQLVYNAERGRYFLLKYDYKTAIPNLLAAHVTTPENIKLRSMLVEAIYERLKGSEGEDTAGLMNYVVQDSFLLDDSRFRKLYGFFLEDYIVTLYEDKHMYEGDQYLSRFEKIVSKEPSFTQDQDDFSEVYIIPAEYYMKNKNNKKAKEYLNRGLLLFPRSKDIKRLLAIIK